MILKNFIDNFNLLNKTAVFAVSEENGQILGFNNCMKNMFPKIEIGIRTSEMFSKGMGDVVDNGSESGKLIVFMNTDAFIGYVEMTDVEIDFEDCGNTRVTLIEPASSMNYKYEKFNNIFSSLFSKNKEVVIMLYLNDMEYEYVHVPGIDMENYNLYGKRKWKDIIELLINEHSDEVNAKIISDNLLPEAIMKEYKRGGGDYSINYSVFVDDHIIEKSAKFEFVEYSDEPIAIVTIRDLQ